MDQYGRPLSARTQPRAELMVLRGTPARQRGIRAGYDAAQDTTDFSRYWSAADALDADSANSKHVRSRLVYRSRYETGNNGYTDGMTQTHATYLVGVGPTLRMQTRSKGFNEMVEAAWARWAKRVLFRRKLWCMAHAKVQDGEAFGLVRANPKVRHRVKLDVVLFETEQCTTPYLPYGKPGYIDGIHFDDWGNPVYYDVLPQHPGGQFGHLNQQPEQVPARYMLHWFQLRRPAQHRGVPEFRSTLHTGAASRRWREATIAAAETAAEIAALLKTQLAPDDGPDLVSPLTTVEFEKRMMMALPMGWDALQMKAEHPNATYDSFNRAQIGEQGRPKSMPYNVAACDSSSYNYASGRLDHQTYFGSLNVERLDCDDLVLDPAFDIWWQEAVLVYGWVGDPDEPPPHTWDWPQHPVADQKSEATANTMKLKSGAVALSQLYAERGQDFQDAIKLLAEDYGVSEDQMRGILARAIFGAAASQTTENSNGQAA